MTDERWQLAYAIYEAAAPLAGPERRQYVHSTAPDAEIAGRVLAMLDEMDTAADLDVLAEPAYLTDAAARLSLAPGSRLGPYEILTRIGEGGMGVVYRARDPRLDRQVAIKLLWPDMASDPHARERLRREAKAAAALDHPYICKIFEIGEDGDALFLVMEYIVGGTLHNRLLNGPMPLADILRVAGEIAEALQEAHSRRFLHRDLKPANIMLTEQGHVKVMDFGLAKQFADRPSADHSTTPLERGGWQLTVPGIVLGTPDHMSPEQARGEELDARTDLFSFGCVLYQMATGQRAFSGTTIALLFDSILHAAPTSPRLLNAELPSKLEEIINKALEKDRELRYQHAADMRADLKRLTRDTGSGPSAVAAPLAPALSVPSAQPALAGRTRGVPLRPWQLAVAALLVLIAGSASVWFATHRASPTQPGPKPRRLTANPVGNPATNAYISPDGKYLAYGDQGGIHIQLIDGGETRTIPQPEGLSYKITGWYPIGWFPDGTKLLAQASSLGAEHSSVWVASVLGGAPREIREGALAWSVSPDGSLIAFSSTVFNSDIWLMGANGEDPSKILTADQGEFFVGVVWSPDNRRIAYGRLRWGPSGAICDIASRDLKTGQTAVILSDPKLAAGLGGGFWWLADGRLIYSLGEAAPVFGPGPTDTNLWEITVDARNGKPAGKPRRITDWTDFSLAIPNATADSKRLVFGRVRAQTDVYVGDVGAGGTSLKNAPRRLTLDERNDEPTAWMPDNKSPFLGFAAKLSEQSQALQVMHAVINEVRLLNRFGCNASLKRCRFVSRGGSFGVGRGPIGHLLNHLEHAGVFVIVVPVLKGRDSFSLWIRDLPVIAVSADRSGDHVRRSAAHELGHILLHRGKRAAEVNDKEAEDFALEFLLPKQDFLDDLRLPLDLDGMAAAKERWKVPMLFMLYRLRRLRKLTKLDYNYFVDLITSRWSQSEPVLIAAEKPRLLRQLAEMCYGLPIDVNHLANCLCLYPKRVEGILDLYQPPPPDTERFVDSLIVEISRRRGRRGAGCDRSSPPVTSEEM